MSYAEELIKLRKRVLDAVDQGLIDIKVKDFYEATLLQIMNEAERQRQNCVANAEQLRKQAAVLDGQAAGYGAQISIVYNVLNAYVVQAEKAKIEAAALADEKAKAESELSDEEKKSLDNLAKEQAKKSKKNS